MRVLPSKLQVAAVILAGIPVLSILVHALSF
jgi:hypothetical protein